VSSLSRSEECPARSQQPHTAALVCSAVYQTSLSTSTSCCGSFQGESGEGEGEGEGGEGEGEGEGEMGQGTKLAQLGREEHHAGGCQLAL
jgi:hypothetical protein